MAIQFLPRRYVADQLHLVRLERTINGVHQAFDTVIGDVVKVNDLFRHNEPIVFFAVPFQNLSSVIESYLPHLHQ